MANILPENETFTFEDREYINPQVSLDEQNAFIDNLRQTQQQNTGEIVQQTRNLGTEVTSNLGGLVGGEGYWTSRYQTPQTNALTSQLRATAQAQALNDVLANEQAMWKKRYQDAYRAYQKRNSGGGGGGDDPEDEDGEDPDFEGTGDTVKVDENPLTLAEPDTTDVGALSAANDIAAITGGGQMPTETVKSDYITDAAGNRTAVKVYTGRGIEVPGYGSFTKEGAKNFINNWIKNGGKVYSYAGKDITSLYGLAWGL